MKSLMGALYTTLPIPHCPYPCPYHTGRGLQTALPTGVSFMNEDQVKSQFVFATFYEGWGWFGTLTDLQPGEGYMLKVHGSGGLATFQI
jgi:hypothetical protein